MADAGQRALAGQGEQECAGKSIHWQTTEQRISAIPYVTGMQPESGSGRQGAGAGCRPGDRLHI
jgi:hypothetical protein